MRRSISPPTAASLAPLPAPVCRSPPLPVATSLRRRPAITRWGPADGAKDCALVCRAPFLPQNAEIAVSVDGVYDSRAPRAVDDEYRAEPARLAREREGALVSQGELLGTLP